MTKVKKKQIKYVQERLTELVCITNILTGYGYKIHKVLKEDWEIYINIYNLLNE